MKQVLESGEDFYTTHSIRGRYRDLSGGKGLLIPVNRGNKGPRLQNPPDIRVTATSLIIDPIKRTLSFSKMSGIPVIDPITLEVVDMSDIDFSINVEGDRVRMRGQGEERIVSFRERLKQVYP